ncbi:hypothetical protein Pan14r_18060 [Crateriforma conspicua]|uniref:Uncharacterized protein n=1 Tax=Crateriforma conspicua TaxID=2527996 RepID=A0A5C5Y3K6_9PLAN|nr:hypothetical protein Mal65_32780 [Crateriforma conspicua]TWT69518.1 hypothetical protein Pan14r_18060 [Crateriforma conspicua]
MGPFQRCEDKTTCSGTGEYSEPNVEGYKCGHIVGHGTFCILGIDNEPCVRRRTCYEEDYVGCVPGTITSTVCARSNCIDDV